MENSCSPTVRSHWNARLHRRRERLLASFGLDFKGIMMSESIEA